MKHTEHKASVYISLGSNLGDRSQHLDKAIREIAGRLGEVEGISRIYESPSWGYNSRKVYYNCCLALRTPLSAEALMKGLLDIEKALGRVRSGSSYADREIDLDLLLYEQLVLDIPGLKLPHPRMEERRFVLLPLAEIAPELLHPVSGLSIRELLGKCQDQSQVRPL